MSRQLPVISLGADPEIFIQNLVTGQYLPAHVYGLPRKNQASHDHAGSVLRDGFAVELNPNADTCRALMLDNFWGCVDHVKEGYLETSRNKAPVGLIARSAVEIDLDTMTGAPHDVRQFGCDGAWNAYLKRMVRPRINAMKHPLRYSGGHMHGAVYTQPPWSANLDGYCTLAKLFDLYVGQLETYLVGSEWAGLRRQYYGQAGEFRIQQHLGTSAAIEYRTPGSEIFSHPALTSLMYGLFRYVIQHYSALAERYDTRYETQVRDIINAGVSRTDAFDLIPRMRGWYTPKTLRTARQFFSERMHQDLLLRLEDHLEMTELEYGWPEWCLDHTTFKPRKEAA